MSSRPQNDIRAKMDYISRTMQQFLKKMDCFKDWWKANQDVIDDYIVAFGKLHRWQNAVDKLKKSQIVFTEPMTKEVIDEVYAAQDADSFLLKYYTENDGKKLDELVHRCGKARQVLEYKNLYPEVIVASQMRCYQLACLGLFSLEDGILADIAEDPKNTSFKKRIKELEDKIDAKLPLSDIDLQIWAIFIAFDSFKETAFANSHFNKSEPDGLNRNWALHGRSRRNYTVVDFIKMLLSLDALILLTNIADKADQEDAEDKEDEL